MKKLLIVDDERAMTESTARFFNAKNEIEAFPAFSVEEGIESIKTNKPDIMLVDLTLGSRSGLDVIRFAKEEVPNSIIMIFSGLPDDYSEAEAMRMGVKQFIHKPISFEELIKLVGEAAKEEGSPALR